MRETAVEKRLREGVEARGGMCKKWVSPGWTGAPDRIVFLPYHVVVFVEVKAPGKYPTKLQRERILELRAMGQRAGWLGSYEDVDRFLSGGPLNEV